MTALVLSPGSAPGTAEAAVADLGHAWMTGLADSVAQADLVAQAAAGAAMVMPNVLDPDEDAVMDAVHAACWPAPGLGMPLAADGSAAAGGDEIAALARRMLNARPLSVVGVGVERHDEFVAAVAGSQFGAL